MRFINSIERHKNSIIVLATVALLVIGLINLYASFKIIPTSNDECLWREVEIDGKPALQFSNVKVGGVTYNAGIRDGDILLKINDFKAEYPNPTQFYLNKFKEGSKVTYTYLQNNEVKTGIVEVKKLVLFNVVSFNILGIIWLLIGFVVVMTKTDGEVQKIFYLIGVLFIINLSMVFSNNVNKNIASTFINIASNFALYFLPFLIIHFFWIFPKRFTLTNHKNYYKIFFALPTILFTIYLTFSIVASFIFNQGFKYQQTFYGAINLFILIAFLSGFISLVINFKRLVGEERKKLFIIVLSYGIGVSAIIYTNFVAPAISDTIYNSPEYYMPILLVILIPIAFGISIFKYQLMDVSIVVKNAIIYGTATISIAATYFLIIYLLGVSISGAIGTEYQGIIAGVIFIIFSLVFQSTKDKFQDFITAKFYPEQFAFQKVLLSFINRLSQVVGIDNILDTMQETFVKALNLSKFGILVKDNDSCLLVRSVGIENKNYKVAETEIQKFINERLLISKVIVIEREDFPKVFSDNINELIEDGIYSVIPMMVNYKVKGLLLFGLKHSGARFAGKDLELLSAAANQSAIFIENARLYKLENEKIKIERDLDLARKIQVSLLPKCSPSIQNLDICGKMIPAMQVGGDYYDYIQVSPTKVYVVVGDVSGKGLSAALYMTKVQSLFQMACTLGSSPKEILIDINKKLYQQFERNWFVTITLGLFDTEKMTLTFCRAGHMPLLAAKNGTVESYRNKGLGLGLENGKIFDSTLVENEIELKKGQSLAFFSDGITETMNEHGEMFGEEKLSTILKNKDEANSSKILEEVYSSVNKFRKTVEQEDDMTIVIVKRN